MNDQLNDGRSELLDFDAPGLVSLPFGESGVSMILVVGGLNGFAGTKTTEALKRTALTESKQFGGNS